MWEAMKDIKEKYSINLADFAIQNRVAEESAFAYYILDLFCYSKDKQDYS